MKFWRSSSKNKMGLAGEKKGKQSSGSSRLKAIFQFFTKKSFSSPKMKFLPPIQSPHLQPVVPKPIQTPILIEEKRDEICITSTSTASPQKVKKSTSIVAKLMGLELTPPPQNTSQPVLDTPQKRPSETPLPKPANNTSQTIQDKYFQEVPSEIADVSILVQPAPENAATYGLVQNILPVVSKPSHQNQKKLEQYNVEIFPTRPVKSPPRSPSPVDNAKILEATARLLEIGSQPIRTAAMNLIRHELQDPVIEGFGSKLNNASKDLDKVKNTPSNTDNKAKINEQVNVGGREASTKRDISSTNTASSTETRRGTQKDPSKMNAQENISAKLSPRPNKIKQNHVPLNNAPKDFIALNKSLIKTTPLRKKNKGLERKQDNKISAKKVRPTDFSNKSGNAKIGKIKEANVKVGGKEMLISKGVGLVSEKPPDFKNRAREEEEMCIVSFTFSAPMKHSNRYTSSSDLEGRSDSGLTESSVSSSVLLDDGKDSLSYRDTHISPSTIHHGPSLYEESVSGRSNELSDSKLDADKKETLLIEAKVENSLVVTKFAPTNTDALTSEKRRNEITPGVRSTRNRRGRTSIGSSKIELFLQTVVFSNQNSGDQVSSFLSETTDSVLKDLSKMINNCKEINQLREEVIADFVIEHLYSVQYKVLNCGYNSWRNFRSFYTKERIVREIKKEVADLERLEGKRIEVLIGKDMESWINSRVDFEIGIHIEKEIISQLISEVVHDFLTP